MEVPRPEYPRPDFERSKWINLNGEWQFEIDVGKSGFEKGWNTGKGFSRKIIVPYPPESSLSGVEEKDFMESVWYRHFFDIPYKWLDGRVLLHFGAVDYETAVWLCGKQVGYHRGGYTPFTCDITDAVKAKDNELVVWAQDQCYGGLQPSGKQSHCLNSWGCFYTRVTGIWQTVWVESAPRTYIKAFRLTTDPYNGKVFLRVQIEKPTSEYTLGVKAYEKRRNVAEIEVSSARPVAEMLLSIPNPRTWSPEAPYLYDLTLQLTDSDGKVDKVNSYFGLREIRTIDNRILLNNETRFLRLVLDQGFYPDGIYTAPTDEDLKRDIEMSQAVGFDGAMLHQKVFEPRFLYWADRLGYLVVGEFGDWGANLAKSEARDAVIDEWFEVLQRDINHPCIIIWTPFNERIFNVKDPIPDFFRRMVSLTKLFDPTRPVIDTSGFTHVETDIYDVHDYEQKVNVFQSHYAELEKLAKTASSEPAYVDWRKRAANIQTGFPYVGQPFMPSIQDLRREERLISASVPYEGQPFMVSEYGGIWWHPEAKASGSWGYGDRPASVEELIARYKALTESLLFHPAISSFCYTQLYDIEQETNGIYTYDRRPKVDPKVIRAINKQEAAVEKIWKKSKVKLGENK